MLLSVIVPCYNEEAALPHFLPEIQKTAEELREKYGLETGLLFVDDGSRDGTLDLLRRYAREDARVRYISFSRNFGKEAAMYAGLENARGDYVVTMDADLQDPPSMLPEMIRAVGEEGYDSAATRWWTPSFLWENTTASPRAFTDGWASKQSGSPMRTLRG